MKWVIYIFAVLFLAMGLAVFFAYSRSKHNGLLLMGFTYSASAILALVLMQWWPLVAGFALVWIMRAMGMEPELEPSQAEADSDTDATGQDRKTRT